MRLKCPTMKLLLILLLLILLRTSSGSIRLDPIHPCAALHTVLCILVVLSAVQHIHSLCPGFSIFSDNCNCHHSVGLKLPVLQIFSLFSNLYGIHSSKGKATGEKRPATALELGTYALPRSFSHASHRDRSRSSVPHRSYVPVTGGRYPVTLKTCASRLVLCAV